MTEREAHVQARHRRRRQLPPPMLYCPVKANSDRKSGGEPPVQWKLTPTAARGIYHIRASSGNRRTRDWEVSLAPVSAVCRSLPVAHKRQGCSEYRAHGETATEHPENTEPVGKAGMQPQGETDQVNTNKLRIPTLRGTIPTLWGKVSPSTGRSMPCDAAVGGTDTA